MEAKIVPISNKVHLWSLAPLTFFITESGDEYILLCVDDSSERFHCIHKGHSAPVYFTKRDHLVTPIGKLEITF